MEEAILTEERGRLFIQRIFAASRDRVWKAWTDPELIVQWWGPADFTAPVIKVELREGGRYLYAMRSPEGQEFWSTGEYREIVPMERLVFTDSFADAEGNVVPASTYGMSADWPRELLVTVTFEEHGGGTKVTLREAGIPAGETLDMAEAGWNESLDKLARVLGGAAKTHLTAEPGKQELVITQIFDAPRDLVFKAYTDPELVPRWWGPRSYTTTVKEMDARPGGTWRYVQRDAGGEEYGFYGVYHDVTPPERLIYTFEFEPMPGHVALETVTLEDLNGRTKVTDRVVYQTVEDRDGTLQSGMEEGMNETMDRFADLLKDLSRG
ncbi:MAG: SRPBCC domain-containing protein [Massilibacteroides sp.]|nr:SRPBCC domain-containing protein [Massilibacteroides sp.]